MRRSVLVSSVANFLITTELLSSLAFISFNCSVVHANNMVMTSNTSLRLIGSMPLSLQYDLSVLKFNVFFISHIIFERH